MASRKRPSLRENITPADAAPAAAETPSPVEAPPAGDAQPEEAVAATTQPETPAAEPAAEPATIEPAAVEPVPVEPAPAVPAESVPAEPAAAQPDALQPDTPPPESVAAVEPAGGEAPTKVQAPEPEPAPEPPAPTETITLAAAPADADKAAEANQTKETVMTSSPSEPVVEPVTSFQPPPAPAPAQAKSTGAVVLASLSLFLSVAAVGAVITTPLWSPDAKRQKAAAVALDGRVGTLETRLGGAASGAPLADRIAALETSLGALDKKLAAMPDGKGIGALALTHLRDALRGSSPFAAELVAVKASGVADEALSKTLDRLTPHAAAGVPTMEQLAARFLTTVPEVLAADLRAVQAAAQSSAQSAAPAPAAPPAAAADAPVAEAPGISDRLWNMVYGAADLLRFTATSAVQGKGAAAVLEKAGALVVGGDYVAAVEVLATLEAEAAEAAKPWLADARARIAADQAVALIGTRSAALLAPKS